MRLIGLFSGIGGFELAATWLGWEIVAMCEIDPYCQKVLTKHWPGVPIHEDIRTTDWSVYRGRVDIVTGGFPCQPFSVAGKQGGADDDRYLWPAMFTAIKNSRPAWVVAENVPGLVRMELDNCCADLESAGYQVQPIMVPACAVDAPHQRDRLWIVAHSMGIQNRRIQPPGLPAHSLPDCHGTGRAHAQRGERQAGTTGRRLVGTGGIDGWVRRWLPEPCVDRVVDGLPNVVDRLRGLGNAIVPAVAYQILKAIDEADRSES